MSMFHELMMRKKEEIMYATIKGTLTESPEGVFSGFSASDYLALQQRLDFNNNFDVVFKINITEKTSGFHYILRWANEYNSSFSIYYGGGGQLSAIVDRDYNTSTNIAISNVTSLQNNTTYFIRLKREDNTFYLGYSTDGVSYSYGNVIGTGINYLWRNFHIGDSVIDGSIDLPNSYIKLGATKYNLQAVVGYTIVGSPTITDGVVSGFSSSDYLMTSSNYTTNNMNNDDYEFGVKLTPTSSMSNECYAIKYYNNSTVRGIGIHNNKFIWSVGQPNTAGHQTSIISSFNVTTNTTYWLKGIYKNKIASLYYSLDGTNYTLIESIDETDQTFKITSAFNFGATAGSSYGLFLGSIDMKETYIKVNNKLWFNGQQA